MIFPRVVCLWLSIHNSPDNRGDIERGAGKSLQKGFRQNYQGKSRAIPKSRALVFVASSLLPFSSIPGRKIMPDTLW